MIISTLIILALIRAAPIIPALMFRDDAQYETSYN